MRNIFAQLIEKTVDKWCFGDIEVSDYQEFADALIEQCPDIHNGSVLFALSYETTDLEDLSLSFANCMAEMGKPLSSVEPLDYVRSRSQYAFETVVFSATDDDIAYVASLDRGLGIEQYIFHLKEVIFQQEGLFTNHRYVNEVVQLGSNYVESNHQHAFAWCNCLIAQNILWDIDHATDITWRFEKKIGECQKLPKTLYADTLRCIETAYRYQKLRQLKPDAFSGNALR